MATKAVGGAQGLLVLHVEDEPSISRAVASTLRRAGYEVISVATAEAAFIVLGSRSVDVVVSDFNLAGFGNGADVLACARALRQPPAFLFVSSDERAGSLGVPWIEKPCGMAAIQAALALLDPPKVVREMPLDGMYELGGEA